MGRTVGAVLLTGLVALAVITVAQTFLPNGLDTFNLSKK